LPDKVSFRQVSQSYFKEGFTFQFLGHTHYHSNRYV
jgi:hypothetical protein